MIISFAWTTPALLAGAKTVTRRDWSIDYARRFRAGMLVDAWDRSPRTGKGRKVATIRITREPYVQSTGRLRYEDFVHEGFAYLLDHGGETVVDTIWRSWETRPRHLYVVEFELVERVSSASPAAPPASGEGPNLDNGIRHGT